MSSADIQKQQTAEVESMRKFNAEQVKNQKLK